MSDAAEGGGGRMAEMRVRMGRVVVRLRRAIGRGNGDARRVGEQRIELMPVNEDMSARHMPLSQVESPPESLADNQDH